MQGVTKASTRLYIWLFGWPFDLGVSMMMIALGIVVIMRPDQGIAGYASAVLRNIGANAPWSESFGIITILCALELLYHPSAARFAVFSLPVFIYCGLSIPYVLDGLIHANNSVGLTAVVAWPFIYWILGWVNTRRAVLFYNGATHDIRAV